MSNLYKYVGIERLKGFLRDHKIRFTQPGAFNDPFEMVPLLLVPQDIVPQGYRSYNFDLRTPRRSDAIVYARIDEDRCSDHHSRELRQALDQEIGFLCLSRTWKSLPMWAHYADEYAGAVMELDGDHEFFDWAFDVHYSSHRPVRDYRFVPRALSDCQRVHNPRNPNYPIYVTEIPPECIERVILGERFNEDEAFEIYRLAERADVMVSRSYVNHWDYNLGLFGTSYRKGGKIINSPSLRNPRDFPNL